MIMLSVVNGDSVVTVGEYVAAGVVLILDPIEVADVACAMGADCETAVQVANVVIEVCGMGISLLSFPSEE
jgi:hypothetical protein